MVKKTNKATKAQDHDEIVKSVLDRFNDSWNYASKSYHLTWENSWKLYRNQRVKRTHKGTVDTFVPMTFSLIETMTAALGNGRPAFDYVPEYKSQQGNTDVLSAMVTNYWQKDGWDNKVLSGIRQMLITGNAPLFIYWDIDRPRMVHFSIRDFIMDPTSTGPENWKYAGRRYLTCLDDLKSYEVVDPTTGETIPRFSNLDNIESKGVDGGEPTDKQNKELFLGSTLEKPSEKQVEVIEIWDHDRVRSIANRSVLIEDMENPGKVQARLNGKKDDKGYIPFILLRDYIDESLPYAMGEVEPITPQQELLNDLTNQFIEANLFTLYPMGELDPSLASWIDRVQAAPGRVFPFKPGSLKYMQPPIIPAQIFNERMNIKQEIRETTAIDQTAKGVTSATAQTATEIKAQLGQASQRIEIKARSLEKDGFYQMGKLLFCMIKLYVDRPKWVRVSKETGVEFAMYDPTEFFGNYDPVVQLDISRQADKLKTQESSLKAYQILIQDPMNNIEEVKKRLLPKMFDLDIEDITAILTPPAQNPMDPNAMGGQMGQPAQPPMPGMPQPPMPPMPQSPPQPGVSM